MCLFDTGMRLKFGEIVTVEKFIRIFDHINIVTSIVVNIMVIRSWRSERIMVGKRRNSINTWRISLRVGQLHTQQ